MGTRAGFLVTLVDQQMVEPDLADDEAVGVGAEVEGGGLPIIFEKRVSNTCLLMLIHRLPAHVPGRPSRQFPIVLSHTVSFQRMK